MSAQVLVLPPGSVGLFLKLSKSMAIGRAVLLWIFLGAVGAGATNSTAFNGTQEITGPALRGAVAVGQNASLPLQASTKSAGCPMCGNCGTSMGCSGPAPSGRGPAYDRWWSRYQSCSDRVIRCQERCSACIGAMIR